MNRLRITMMMVAGTLLSVAVAQGEPPKRSPDVTSTKQAKAPAMSFTEIERHKNYSIVAATIAPGAGAPPPMFVVKGCYEMAKRRGAAYFVTLKDWQDAKGNWNYIVGFSPDDKIDPASYFDVAIDPKKELMFKAVKDYDLLWSTGR